MYSAAAGNPPCVFCSYDSRGPPARFCVDLLSTSPLRTTILQRYCRNLVTSSLLIVFPCFDHSGILTSVTSFAVCPPSHGIPCQILVYPISSHMSTKTKQWLGG